MSPIVILNPPLFSLLQFWLASELLPLTALEPPHVSADAVCCFGFFLQVACSAFHDDGTGPGHRMSIWNSLSLKLTDQLLHIDLCVVPG